MEGIDEAVGNECLSREETCGETKPGDEVASQSPKEEEVRVQEDATPQADQAPVTGLEVSLERLLQRQRSEIMFELRRLQYGERPVTGQEQRRRTVENLVLRAVQPPSTSGSRLHNTTTSFTTSTTNENHRPEEIVVEVSALVESRPVSSILQSLGVRRSLENSIRDAFRMTRGGQVQTPVRPVRNATAQVQTPQSSPSREMTPAPNNLSSASNVEEESSRSASDADRSPSRLSGQSSNDVSPDLVPSATEAAGADAAEALINGPSVEIDGGRDRADMIRSWMERDEHQVRGFDLREMYHEQFIAEVSDLIHRQLVTSALNGNFRNVLERRMRHHIENSGIDGSRVQEQLRQLPRSNVLRNDFFDLGIVAGQQAAGGAGADLASAENQLDNMSVISATAAVALPHAYTQSNAAVNRELQSMRSEIQELKNMMRLSFDLQLDIQRSIRQEIAAAINHMPGGAVPQLPTPRAASGQPPAPNGHCLICLDEPVDTVLYRCGHLCLCNVCAMRLRQSEAHCPVCRAPIVDITKIYRP